MIKKILFTAAGLFMALNLPALEAGLFAGSLNPPSSFNFGLSAGMGTIVPKLTFEFEGYHISTASMTSLSGALKFRLKLGKAAPYLNLGVGTEFQKLSFYLSKYHFYTLVGGGVHIYLTTVLSLRFDLRFLHFSNGYKTRVSGGVFLHL